MIYIPLLPPDILAINPVGQVRVDSSADIEIQRELAIEQIFGTSALDDNITLTDGDQIEPELFADSPDVKSIYRFPIVMDYGLVSYVTVFTPTTSRNAAMIYHEGHGASAVSRVEDIEALLADGYTVAAIDMPLEGENPNPVHLTIPGSGDATITGHVQLWEIGIGEGATPLRYFLLPSLAAVNYFDAAGMTEIGMMGLSGGGWTTTLYSALDTRIGSSFSVAGTLPFYLRSVINSIGDLEQTLPGLDLDYSDLYILASSGGRAHYEFYNVFDSCCFRGTVSLHFRDAISDLARDLGGEFQVLLDWVPDSHVISSWVMQYVVDVLDGNTGGVQGQTFLGTDGDDAIVGTDGRDLILGGPGDDIINGFAGMDFVDGGDGINAIILSSTSNDLNNASDDQIVRIQEVSASAAAVGVRLSLNDQTDGFRIIGSGYNDVILGSSGADVLIGGGGSDTIYGGAGWDRTIVNFASSAATITQNSSTLAWTISGAGQTEILTNVEVVQFSNGVTRALCEAPRSDFDGNNCSDILWRSASNGASYENLMIGSRVLASTYVGGGSNSVWSFLGSGDFNGDGRSDILWRNTSNNAVYQNLMNGVQVLSSNYVGGGSNSVWSFIASGDFNCDGRSDILWRNTINGAVYENLMNGSQVLSSTYVGGSNSIWSFAGLGDFNGDGNSDILWRNASNGAVYENLMKGAQILASGYIGSGTWSFIGSGDFNGDGNSDILWRSASNGAVYENLMNGSQVLSSTYVGGGNSVWSFAGLGDFNGDGRSDILWRNASNGAVYENLMNGSQVLSSAYVGGGNAWSPIVA